MNALDPWVAGIGGVLVVAFAALILLNRRPKQRIRPVRADDYAWIDQRIAAETEPARRAAWRMLRNQCREDQ